MVCDVIFYFKIFGGLKWVYVVLWCFDDDFCDLLELCIDLVLGIFGLFEVVCQGCVLVVNVLGSGVLELFGLFGFLLQVCCCLFGEELVLFLFDICWCGEL